MSDYPRLARMRAASKGYEPLDLAGDEHRNTLTGDALWLWDELGRVLLGRGYLTTIYGLTFHLLCSLYTQRNRGPEYEAEFREWLTMFGVTPRLIEQLEAKRRNDG